jgi:hypothetical protein
MTGSMRTRLMEGGPIGEVGSMIINKKAKATANTKLESKESQKTKQTTTAPDNARAELQGPTTLRQCTRNPLTASFLEEGNDSNHPIDMLKPASYSEGCF